MRRRDFLKVASVITGATLLRPDFPAFGRETFPAQKLTWLVGLPAGGGTDVMVRGIAPYFQKYLRAISGNPEKVGVVVKNLPGGGGMRTINEIYHAKPDGYTLACDGEMLHTNTVLGELKFDLFELTYLARLASSGKVIVASSRANLKNWEDVQRLAKKGNLRLGVTGFGGSNHVAAVLFLDSTKLNARIVIFDGSSGLSAALIRGDVLLGMQSEDSVKNLIEAGELKPILTFSSHSLYPDCENVNTIGFPELNNVTNSQRYVVAPPRLPSAIKKALVDCLRKAVNDKDFLAWNERAKMSIKPVFGNELEKLVRDIQKFYNSKERVLKEYLLEKKI